MITYWIRTIDVGWMTETVSHRTRLEREEIEGCKTRPTMGRKRRNEGKARRI